MGIFQIAVQHDWGIDVDNKEGKFWLSSRVFQQPTCHGSAVMVQEGLIGRDGFEAELLCDNVSPILSSLYLKKKNTEA